MVGSSNSKISEGFINVLAKLRRTRQPPEKSLRDLLNSFSLKPKPTINCSALALDVYPSIASNSEYRLPTFSNSFLDSAFFIRSCIFSNSISPPKT